MIIPIVLASTSIYKAKLMERLGLPFTIAAPLCNEHPLKGEEPIALSRRLAGNKAQSLGQAYPNQLIIGCDQVASCSGQILSKPGSPENAIRQLQLQSGQVVDFYTSISVLNSKSNYAESITDHTSVHFRDLSEEEICRYVAREQPMNCAGSFKCELLGITLFKKVITEDPTALEGLPLIQLSQILRNNGYFLP